MKTIQENKKMQLFIGLGLGIVFGFLLQKGGVSKFDIIIGQLRLQDFTVAKIILTAIIVTMLSISYLYPRGLVKLHVKEGSVKNSIIGGLIFGAGFAILGYCPGTIAAAVGNGYLDALFGGLAGIIFGSALFASRYSRLKKKGILTEDKYSGKSFFDNIRNNTFKYTLPFAGFLFLIIIVLEIAGK